MSYSDSSVLTVLLEGCDSVLGFSAEAFSLLILLGIVWHLFDKNIWIKFLGDTTCVIFFI